MKLRTFSSLLLVFGSFCCQNAAATCVLETSEGQTLNCALRLSGLLRIKNLGGVKGFISIGLSQGEEFGFPESESNLEFKALLLLNKLKAAANAVRSRKASNPWSNGIQTAARLVNGAKRSKSSAHSINRDRSGAQTAQKIVNSLLKKSFQHPQNTPPARRPNSQLSMSPSSSTSSTQSQRLTYPGALQTTSPPSVGGVVVPPFQALPASITKLMSVANTTSTSASSAYQPDNTLMGHFIMALAEVSNLRMEAINAAIAERRKQFQAPTPLPKTPAKTATPPPVNTKKYPLSSVSKVMNAPKEYYPVGYDKNFDDNFASRVELPETSFYCGDQKHFPGLYADEDLGCMVFHVCAFTDDGLIMKSFLCPESTLFDQTILKCNWWFYTDCKTSEKLYDSNIPISKSYQLMKALASHGSDNK